MRGVLPGGSRPRVRAALIAGAMIACLGPRPAAAHQASMTFSQIEVSDDARQVDVQMRLNVRDTAEPLGLPVDQPPSDTDITSRADRLFDYVLDRFELDTGDETCAVERRDATIVAQRDRFAQLRWRYTCPRPIDQLAIEYDLFFDIDPLHVGNLVVRYRGQQAVAPLQEGTPRFEWDLHQAAPGVFVPFVREGIAHIWTGFDHISFLFGLLLVAVIALDRGKGGMRVRGVVESVRYTVGIATAFTLAHSITLIAAALGWITLPSRFVESMIAVSIVYIAVENLLRPEPRARWLLTFGFGLVHGLGFASVLRQLLPPTSELVPLLSFNLGVEIGQLCIILAVVPVLHALAHRLLGGVRYRRYVVTAGSAFIAVLGTIWFIERAFQMKLLGL